MGQPERGLLGCPLTKEGNDGRERKLQEGHRDSPQADGREVRRPDEQDGLRRPDDEEVRRLCPRGGVRHAVVAARPRHEDTGLDLRRLRYRPGALAGTRHPSAHGAQPGLDRGRIVRGADASLRLYRPAVGARGSAHRQGSVRRDAQGKIEPHGGFMLLMTTSDLPLKRIARGKVRDVYEVDSDRLLLVATDRVSAYDVVMAEPIPMKGAVLTQVSAWWFRRLGDAVRHHMISADAGEIAAAVPALKPHRDQLAGRAMLCRRGTVFPIECVIRGYLSGSAWREYAKNGTLAGEKLPPGLKESDRLDPPIFSPATKAESGHDENITVGRMREVLGADVTAELERLTRVVYTRGRDVALKRGIIIADTKFEFGRAGSGEILLIDAVMTPDSSRFWPADGYQPGRSQPSFDKQPLRDWLDVERHAGRWNGEAPPPKLPAEVVDATSKRYLEAYKRLTGSELV